MEEMTVVSFFVDREGVAWKKGWKYQIWENAFTGQGYSLRYMQVGLPFWERKDTLWTAKGQEEYYAALPVPLEGRSVCYVYDSEAKILFGKRQQNLSAEWGLFLLEYYGISFEGMILFEDRQMDAQDLALQFAPFTPYVGVVTPKEWHWEEVSEYIQEEYGYEVEVASTFTRLHPGKGTILLWSGEERRGLSPLNIPRESVWLDTCCDRTNRDFLQAIRKKKINYLNLWRFLREFGGTSCNVSGKRV
ncbi:MAG: hypothetical protein IJY10_04795 [Lachnospiraceae bacterium]|nr:hypothetical protein [Lachnospiraceae bacterium]